MKLVSKDESYLQH